MDGIDAGQSATGARRSFGHRTTETAAGFTVESSAENPKNDERTKRQPGGKNFRTCSDN
jgi:hypothetical protein